MTRTRGPIRQDAIPRTGGGTLESRLRPCRPILVVEDERDIAIFLQAYFRATGQAVVHVDPTSPAQVVESVREHHPACVLLDLNLRGFHGREVHSEIRKDPDNEAVPVVVVTAAHSPKTRQEAQAAGAAAFVTKPFSVKDLCQLVTDLVNGAKAGEEAGRGEAQDALQAKLPDTD